MLHMTVNTPTELLNLKINQSNVDFRLENSLEEWANIEGTSNHLYGQFIRGFFRHNRYPLQVYIDSHSVDRRPPPSEDRILQIFDHATLEQKALMALMADTGERVKAVALTTIPELPDLNLSQDMYVILFDSIRTKLHREHVSYYSDSTAQLV